ncbi:MAG: GNAT family N-acetyltransferase [Candidatus Hydrogenedentes bacterium]|nr:GNAT family N-acetyltransferase [Candidatus Hydrogenedentota bacterium]
MPDLEVRGVTNDEERCLAHNLMAKSFGPNYFETIQQLDNVLARYPGFQPEHTRIAIRNGQIAGTLRISTDTIRIGEARLKMGGFGWVAVDDTFRKQGVATLLVEDALAYMRTHNYHVTMLFGIVDFYHRFGFVTMLSDYLCSVNVLEAEQAEHKPYRVRRGKPGDIRAIHKIHNQDESEMACSIVRSTAHVTNQWERWKPVQVITDDQGKVRGYFLPRVGKNELLIEELGIAGHDVCGALLHACAQLAIEHHAPKIRFAAPPNHPFLKYLLRYESKFEMHVKRNRDGMMALINLGETLESMIPEWESRLARSALFRERVAITLLVDSKPYRIRANRGAIDVMPQSGDNKVSLGHAEFVQLLCGYRYLDEVLATKRRILTPSGRALLEVLFPKRTPFVWPVDHF